MKCPVVEYSAAGNVRSYKTLFADMWRDLLASRELAWRLTVKDVRAQYRQSLLGILWAFVPPLATALIFIFLNNRTVINIPATDIPYPVFAIYGTVLWQVFVYSLNAPLRVVTEAKPMLTKINFPREALILSSLWQSLFNLCCKAVILLLVFFMYNIPLTAGILFAPVAMVVLILLGTALGLVVTPAGLLYTDISHGLSLATTAWFFVTPVVYPPPSDFPFSLLATLNPVSPILIGARDLATQGVLHNPVSFFVVTLLMLFILILAWIAYRLAMPILIERMST